MHALAAGLLGGEIEEKARHLYHTGGFIHDDHAAGAHDRACRTQGFIINDGIELFRWDTAAGGAAHLPSLEFPITANAAADAENDVPQGFAHRDFHQTALFNLAREGENLSALAVRRAHGGKSLAAV